MAQNGSTGTSPVTPHGLYVGIDVGTSGCRAVAIDAAAVLVAESRAALPEPVRCDGGVEQDPELWWDALTAALDGLLAQIDRSAIRALAVDGTSGTVLVTDAGGRPLHAALLYSDGRARVEAGRIAAVADRYSAAHGVNGGLAKLLWLLAHVATSPARAHAPADWLAARLTGRSGTADANSMLKLGWDAVRRRWPDWMERLGVPPALLPTVVEPGTPLGPIAGVMAHRFGLPPQLLVVAGTSDSTAAILATGTAEPGDAVTSLGSTLVTKVVAEHPLFAPEYGVYSQPLRERWLVGGGSNSGGAVLRHYFDADRLAELTARLDPGRPTGLDYYPLLAPGERFPVNDPTLPPRLEPRPADDARFLQAMLEGMALIEAAAYRRLAELGAPYPTRVFSVGGGAGNLAWTAIRQAALGVPILTPDQSEAAYGAALLARSAATA